LGVVLFILIPGNSLAEKDYVSDRINGKDWGTFSKEVKISTLRGIYHAYHYISQGKEDCIENFVLPQPFVAGRLQDDLDKFYSDKSNINIRVVSALEVIGMKHLGMPEETIEEYIKILRMDGDAINK
jgi:hypothetical protein